MDEDLEFDVEAASEEVGGGLGLEAKDETPEGLEFKSEPVEAPAEKAPTLTAPVAPVAPKATAPGEATAPVYKAPASWRPEAKTAYDSLPPVVKAEVAKREEDILRGIGEYKSAANFGQAVDRAIAPYAPILRQHNIDPVRHVGELMQVHQVLAFGSPEQKVTAFRQLAKNFSVDLGHAAQSIEDSPYVDPEVAHLRSQLSQLQSVQQQLVNQHTEAQQAQINNIRTNLNSELNTFAADPEHAFFDEVASDMALIIQAGRASSLKQAYEMAVRLTPEVMEKENLRKSAQAASKRQASYGAAAAKTTAARNATGVNVRSSATGKSTGSNTNSGLQNLDTSIGDEFDRIMSGG